MVKETNHYRVEVEPIAGVIRKWEYCEADSPEEARIKLGISPEARLERGSYIQREDHPDNAGLPSTTWQAVE